jgi:hypothetical protein
LVVVVDDGQASVSQRREVWKELTHSSEAGPVLWLTTDSPALVADEVVAALDAMR